jgi:hypothetical protein
VPHRVAIVALLAVAALAGCGGGAGGSSTDASTGPAVAADEAAVPEILRFSAPIVGGSQLDGASLVGRPVAFWFWAPT